MSTQEFSAAFEALTAPAARMALAPLLALGVGVLVFLLCDVVAALRAARAPVFVGALILAAAAEVRILLGERAPGLVFDGTFAADRATALWGLMFVGATLLAWLASLGYYRENRPFKPEHDALMLTTPIGMMLMIGARDLVVFFVGLELLSIPLYALCAFRRMRQESVEAGVKYFLLGSFSSALFLYGAALLYAAAGTLSLVELAERDLSAPLALAGLALVAASLFFKVAVFPFQLWAPDVYQGSPTPVTALMATGTKAAAFGFLLVQLTPILPATGRATVAVLALVTMLLGNLGALVQTDLKRMLAYSSVAHAGTLLLLVAAGMGAPDEHGALGAALYYLGGYLFTAMGAFGLLGLLEADGARFTRLESLRGLARSRPVVSALLALFMLSLGGIPATAGFLGKWFVFAVLVDADMTTVAVLAALLSTIALGYYLRVIVVLYMQPPPEELEPPRTNRWSASLVGALCGAFVLAMGLFPALFLGLLGS
ncbi:MAG: NADH-quinone oxidoreductase subunit N [Planctomycetes bacterium]|nr:NADH-quinone oxidoreductase subunit N [Planctomycetota bacterium]